MTYFSTFDDGSVVEQIGDGGTFLVDIADGEAEEFRYPSVGNHTEDEKPAVAEFKGAGETCRDSADFVFVKGACSFHRVLPRLSSNNVFALSSF